MKDGKYFGLTPAQLNFAFFAIIAVLAVGVVFAAVGPSRVLSEAKQTLGVDSPPSLTHSAQDSTPTPQATAPQATAPPCAQLAVGCEAVVTSTGTWLNLRDTPSINGTTLLRLENGTAVSIKGGPTQSDGHVWWRILTSGSLGWAAEGAADGTKWLVPRDGY